MRRIEELNIQPGDWVLIKGLFEYEPDEMAVKVLLIPGMEEYDNCNYNNADNGFLTTNYWYVQERLIMKITEVEVKKHQLMQALR